MDEAIQLFRSRVVEQGVSEFRTLHEGIHPVPESVVDSTLGEIG
jgi:hypothetical protein